MLPRRLVDDLVAWAERERVATPAFLFSPATVRTGVQRLRRHLGARISYATKANAHPYMLRELRPLVEEFNVTNVPHLDTLLDQGVEPDRITFLHPVCARRTIEAVAGRGVTRFVVDDARGLRMVRTVVGGGARVTLRMRPPDAGESDRSIVRFGNHAEELRQLAHEAVETGVHVEALSFFVGMAGQGMAEALPFRYGIEELSVLREKLAGDGISVATINIGGGFPGSRRRFHQENPEFLDRVNRLLTEHVPADVDVVCEPGRFLSEPSLTMLTRVVADRVLAGRRMVYVDAGGYGGLFESSFIEPGGPDLEIGYATRRDACAPAVVMGPVMDSFDVVKQDADLPPLAEGEPLVLPNTGAYAWGYSTRCEGTSAPEVIGLPEHLDAEFADTWHG